MTLIHHGHGIFNTFRPLYAASLQTEGLVRHQTNLQRGEGGRNGQPWTTQIGSLSASASCQLESLEQTPLASNQAFASIPIILTMIECLGLVVDLWRCAGVELIEKLGACGKDGFPLHETSTKRLNYRFSTSLSTTDAIPLWPHHHFLSLQKETVPHAFPLTIDHAILFPRTSRSFSIFTGASFARFATSDSLKVQGSGTGTPLPVSTVSTRKVVRSCWKPRPATPWGEGKSLQHILTSCIILIVSKYIGKTHVACGRTESYSHTNSPPRKKKRTVSDHQRSHLKAMGLALASSEAFERLCQRVCSFSRYASFELREVRLFGVPMISKQPHHLPKKNKGFHKDFFGGALTHHDMRYFKCLPLSGD